jgi:hypothetical protein
MAWNIRGTYFENCSCDMVCPCTTSALSMPADYDRCEVVLAFNIEEGTVEGVDVNGRRVVLVADTPKMMAEGNWKVGMFVDDGATSEQVEKLAGVFSGALGGPLEVFAALVGEMLGMEQAPIEFVDDGRLHSVTVGNAVDIEIEDFVPPGSPTGEVSMLTGMAVPFNSTLTIAKANRSRTDAFGLSFANEGQNGHSAPFSWAA